MKPAYNIYTSRGPEFVKVYDGEVYLSDEIWIGDVENYGGRKWSALTPGQGASLDSWTGGGFASIEDAIEHLVEEYRKYEEAAR
jgi:hypothetical protein